MSEVKVNKISPRSGTEVTLGDSGDTFTIPSGATINNQGTATNFGATGSASWNTTVKTADFTAVAGEGYFVNTTSGEVDIALPAGTPGAVVAIKDYAGTFDTNRVLLVQNGSDKIGGSTINVQLSEEGIAVTLVFVDSTQGWLVTDSGLQSEAPSPSFIAATGGTITTSGNFKIHTFTGPGTFTVCSVGNAAGSNTVDYLVVAGGASGGNGGGPGGGSGTASGGGGAGGYRESSGTASGSYTISPLGCGVSALPVSATGFPITVGAGGASNGPPTNQQGNPGANSIFSTITSTGGGTGGGWTPSPGSSGVPGGSGGGASQTGSIGSGNTPPVTPPQGNDGGPPSTPNGSGGGGGGATAAGAQGTAASPGPANAVGGVGGAGATSSITASPVARAGGGGGGTGGDPGPPPGAPGPASSGGGAGGTLGANGTAGTVNTGGGGGGGGANPGKVGGAGGSGIVIIRYKFQ